MTEPTPTPYTAPPAAPGTTTNVLAIIALIAAIVFAPVGIILGFIAQGQIKTSGEAGAGLAKAAIIIGIVLTVLWIVIMVASFLIPLMILGSYGSVGY